MTSPSKLFPVAAENGRKFNILYYFKYLLKYFENFRFSGEPKEASRNDNEPQKRKSSYAFWTLRRVLAVAGLLIVAAVAAIIWWSGQSYRDFSLNTLNNSAATTISSFVSGRIDKVYGKRLQTIVRTWSRSKNLLSAVNKPDAESRAAYASAMFNVKEARDGQVALRDVFVFDQEFNLLAQGKDGIGASLVLSNDAYRELLGNREKQDARIPVGHRFASENGVPLYSMVAPIGGFKAVGFVEVITDPLEDLSDVGDVLGGQLELLDNSGSVLFTSVSKELQDNPDDQANLASIKLDVKSEFGGNWAHIRFTRDISAFANSLKDVTTQALTAFLVGILGILIVVFLMMRFTIFRNLNQFADAALELADGNAEVTIPKTGRDEIGRVGTAMEKLRAAVSGTFLMKHLVENTPTPTALIGTDGRVEILNAAARASLQVESGNELEANFLGLNDTDARNLTNPDGAPLSTQVSYHGSVFAVSSAPVRNEHGVFLGSMLAWNDITSAEEDKRLTESLLEEALGVVEAVAEQSKQLRSTAGDLDRQSDENIDRTKRASTIAQSASGDINMVAGTTQQLAASIKEVNRQAGEASTVSQEALRKAELGQERIQSLEDASNQIGSIVDLITDIAHRTRLLSLNATIEAQRAGEMGRGFNVVANEVKNLADQTAEATSNISQLTLAIQTHIGDTTGVMGDMRDIIESMHGFQSAIALSVDEQHAATEEMTARITQIASGSSTIESIIEEVNQNTQHTRDNAQNLTQASSELAQSAESMRSQMLQFRHHFAGEGD